MEEEEPREDTTKNGFALYIRVNSPGKQKGKKMDQNTRGKDGKKQGQKKNEKKLRRSKKLFNGTVIACTLSSLDLKLIYMTINLK